MQAVSIELPKKAMDLTPEQQGVKMRVWRAARAKNLNLAEVARIAGVAKGYVHKATKWGSKPRSHEVRVAIARALDVDPSWLWNGVAASEQQVPSFASFETRTVPDPGASIVPLSRLDVSAQFRPDPKGYFVVVEDERYAPLAKVGDALHLTPSYPLVPGCRVRVVAIDDAGREAPMLAEFISRTSAGVVMRTSAGAIVQMDNERIQSIHRLATIAFG